MNSFDILVIDDNDTKSNHIIESLNMHKAHFSANIERAADAISAMRMLEEKHYDLVILDLLLPYMKGGSPLRDSSEDIIAKVISEGSLSPSYVIGLTEFRDEASKGMSLSLFPIEIYDRTRNDWSNKLNSHIAYLIKTKRAALAYHHKSFDLDVLIITARYVNEFVPISEAINWEDNVTLTDKMFSASHAISGVWRTKKDFAFRTAIMCVKYTGLSSTAAVASSAIAYYRPSVVAMLGMCAGLNEENASDQQNLGDIVIMNRTNCWDEGRYTARQTEDVAFFEARPSSRGLNTDIQRVCDELIETGVESLEKSLKNMYQDSKYSSDILKSGKTIPENPRVRAGMNVSGSSVVAAKRQTAEIMKRFPGARSLEMEAHALYTAAYLSPGTESKAVCIKGIADFADGSKSKEYQKIASLGSILVFEEILERLRIDSLKK